MVRTEIYKVELDAWRVARSWLIKTLNSVPSPNLCLCSIPGKDALLHPNMKSYCSLTPHLPSKPDLIPAVSDISVLQNLQSVRFLHPSPNL